MCILLPSFLKQFLKVLHVTNLFTSFDKTLTEKSPSFVHKNWLKVILKVIKGHFVKKKKKRKKEKRERKKEKTEPSKPFQNFMCHQTWSEKPTDSGLITVVYRHWSMVK